MDQTIQTVQKQMSQANAILAEDLGTIRAGRANPQLIEHIRISAYDGTQELMLSELATITTSDAKTMVITPFDQSIADEIEKGINQANIGVSVSRDGTVIRIAVPPMTEERREEFIKLAKTKTEGVRVMIRQARQEAMNDTRDQLQNKEIDEDDKNRVEKEIQKITDEQTDKAETLLESKIKELKTI